MDDLHEQSHAGQDDAHEDEFPEYKPTEVEFRATIDALKHDMQTLKERIERVVTLQDGFYLALEEIRTLPTTAEDWDEVECEFDRTSVAEDVDVHLCEVEAQLRQVRVAFDNLTGVLNRRLDKVKHNAAGYMAAYAPVQPSKDGEQAAMRMLLELFGGPDSHVVGPIETEDVEATTEEIHNVLADLAARNKAKREQDTDGEA